MRIERTYDKYDFYTETWSRETKVYEGHDAELILKIEAKRDTFNTIPEGKPSENRIDDHYLDYEEGQLRLSGEKL